MKKIKKLIRTIISYYLYENVGYDLEAIEHIVVEVPKVYCHITNGRMSKANYNAIEVIAVADDCLCVNELIETIDRKESKISRKQRLESVLEEFSDEHWEKNKSRIFYFRDLKKWIITNSTRIEEILENFIEYIDQAQLINELLNIKGVKELADSTYETPFEQSV